MRPGTSESVWKSCRHTLLLSPTFTVLRYHNNQPPFLSTPPTYRHSKHSHHNTFPSIPSSKGAEYGGGGGRRPWGLGGGTATQASPVQGTANGHPFDGAPLSLLRPPLPPPPPPPSICGPRLLKVDRHVSPFPHQQPGTATGGRQRSTPPRRWTHTRPGVATTVATPLRSRAFSTFLRLPPIRIDNGKGRLCTLHSIVGLHRRLPGGRECEGAHSTRLRPQREQPQRIARVHARAPGRVQPSSGRACL